MSQNVYSKVQTENANLKLAKTNLKKLRSVICVEMNFYEF